MIEPKEIPLKGQDGKTRTYIISKFPAIQGREIVTKYPVSNLPKLGEYQQSEETMLKLMAFVQVVPDGGSPIALTTRALVDNHVPDWEVLARLEYAMLEHNCSFFGNGLNSASFESIARKAVEWITKTLMASSPQSSQTDKPRSTN
jgi:hypothetical protein